MKEVTSNKCVKEYVNWCIRTGKLRQVIFAFEVFRTTSGNIACYANFGSKTIWLRHGL
jgi:hypothetical protein